MEAIILAGGKGTRLSDIVKDTAKPMAKIGAKPFLDLLIQYINLQGVKKFYLALGYKHETIRRYFEDYKLLDGSNNIFYSIEETLLGTGGAIVHAIKSLNISEEDILVFNGDSFNLFDIKAFYRLHKENNNDITMLTKYVENTDRYGRVTIENEQVIGFEEKIPGLSGKINAGIYVIKTDIFNKYNLPEAFSFETDFLEKYTKELKVGYFDSGNYFIDFGVPDDYYKAADELPELIDKSIMILKEELELDENFYK